jgi:hypothetical protein
VAGEFIIENARRGYVVVRVPSGSYLINGKTGSPHEFDRREVHSLNYGGRDTELYRVLKSLTMLEDKP